MKWLLMCSLLTLSAACGSSGDGHSTFKLETDDRWTPETAALIDVSPVINQFVAKKMDEARQEVNPTGEPWTDQLKLRLFREISSRITEGVAGTGIGFVIGSLDIEVNKYTTIEVYLKTSLKPERHEIHFTSFQDSRYGDN